MSQENLAKSQAAIANLPATCLVMVSGRVGAGAWL